MTGLLLAFLALQVIPGPSGTATGVVRSSNGLPAAGIRVVAIPAGDPNSILATGTVFESLAQTDATGHFSLAVPPGRYYIAAGSVSSPTYYPDTSDLAAAKPIVISAGTTVENVNFSKYVAAVQGPALGLARQVLPPGSTGILTGVIRSADGSPAKGVPVVAAPLSLVSATGVTVGVRVGVVLSLPTLTPVQTSLPVSGVALSITDANGRYRFENVSPDSYNILAGFSDSPAFYPSANDVKVPATVTTTPTTRLDKLDFTLPALLMNPVTVRGRVSGNLGKAAGGAEVSLINGDRPPVGIAGMLPRRSYKNVITDGDGTYKFDGVVPGSYTVQARLGMNRPNVQSIAVTDQPVNVDFAFSISVVSGRILWDDGSPFSDRAPNQVAFSTIDNPNFIQTTLVPITNGGAFSGVVESDDYRFFVPDLPTGLTIRSVTAGTVDLAKETLKFRSDVPEDIEIRIARQSVFEPKITGKVIDALTGKTPAADRVRLCCFGNGPVQRVSTPLLPDGAFEFSGIPEGRYSVELQGKAPPQVMNSQIVVGSDGLSNVQIITAAQFVWVQVTVNVDGGGSLPAGITIPVTWTAAKEGFHLTTSATVGGTLSLVPSGILYNVTASGIPPGFQLKSIYNGTQNLAASPDPQTSAPVLSSTASNLLVVTLARTSP